MSDDKERNHKTDPIGQETDKLEITLSHQDEHATGHVTRRQIALDTLSRYSGSEIEEFQPFILLTNFPHYVETFAKEHDTEVRFGAVLKVAHCPKTKISIVDYRVGAPMAALVVDVISYLKPQSVVMLGLCGGLHRRQQVGDFLLPMAAIRDEGASKHYMPMSVPSLPSLVVQQFISETLLENDLSFSTGVVHTTDYRMWEFDESFKDRLKQEKATAIDMECSALFTAGFARKVPIGALMLVSDLPLMPSGIKTKESSKRVFREYTGLHLKIGVKALEQMAAATKERKINFRQFQFM